MEQSQTQDGTALQDGTDKTDDRNDSTLPQGWFQINRLLAKRISHGVQFFKVEWTDLGTDGKLIISWERASSVTKFAIDQYNLSLDAKRKRRNRRKQRK
jgi:hypothetical protein